MILHVDMDAFYAAIEVREYPELAGKPVIVGADPSGRGVVSTCSYEARRFGVHSAMPIREAYRRCPQGVFLPVRMALYVEVSREVMELLRSFTPYVEPLSIDEAFLDVSGCERLFGEPETMGRLIREEIRRVTRLSCSVGVAPNKFLAKLATELGKPDGLTVIAPDRIEEVLSGLPASRVFGVGRRTLEKLEAVGMKTVGDLARAPLSLLEAQVGRAAAAHIQALARGQDDRRVEPSRRPGSLGSERTFQHDLRDRQEMRRQLLDLAGDVGRGLRGSGFYGSGVRLKVRTDDFHTYTRERRLEEPTDSDRRIWRVACELLEASPPGRPVRLLGVTAVALVTERDPRQGLLFATPGEPLERPGLDRAADSIRSRFGDTALRPASLLAPAGRRRDEK